MPRPPRTMWTKRDFIHEPTLWYFGQCCILFGTVIGVIRYVDGRIQSVGG